MQGFDWPLVLWTFVSWLFSGGILYLVYQLGYRVASEGGAKVSVWRTIALLLGFVVCLAMFGTDYHDTGLILELSGRDLAVFLGIFLIVLATCVLGFVDAWRRPRVGTSPEDASDVPPLSS